MDPVRTDRVSVWINKANDLLIMIDTRKGIEINFKNMWERCIDKFQILR